MTERRWTLPNIITVGRIVACPVVFVLVMRPDSVLRILGFVLFLPGLLAIFPDIPTWTQQIFPTYYIMNPVIQISQNNAGLGDIAVEVGVMLALTGAMMVYLVTVFERQQQKLALDT